MSATAKDVDMPVCKFELIVTGYIQLLRKCISFNLLVVCLREAVSTSFASLLHANVNWNFAMYGVAQGVVCLFYLVRGDLEMKARVVQILMRNVNFDMFSRIAKI